MPKREFVPERSQGSVTSDEKKRKLTLDGALESADDISKRRVNDDYTVGWISAITTEYVAAQAFLDEEHDRPEYVSPNDSNDYTLGEIGKHNVVIAVLPGGEYGIASAAIVARDMLHSFPNVRICLMVGIGGGAPSQKHDIRLGDVVVSEPRDRIGGVFQYDFGKTIQGQSFHTTSFLNQPPTVLRTAINGIKAQYKRKGHRLAEAIIKILDDNPRLRPEYERPSLETDKLYRSGVTHPPNDGLTCADICGDDPSQLVSRSERTKVEDNPAIHYGLIASANQLMKNALIRDALAAEKNIITEGITGKEVLCFEMEAAGLMNHFPCLVIRGICDYSDSHKSKKWQGYAAMTAAAYAKDLLYRIPPNKVEAEKRIGEIFLSILPTVSRTNANVEVMRYKLNKDEDVKILSWLTPVDYAAQQRNFISLRQEGTGQWLLDSTEFQKWLKADNQTLFCPGIPGAGKTFITSIVINYLQINYKNSGIAYIYCNVGMQDEQTPEGLLKSILKQLVRKQSLLPKVVKDLYDQHIDNQSRPGLREILEVLKSIISSDSRTFIIIDALDECQNHDRCRDILLSEIFTLQARTRLNIFVTSRPQEVEAKFSESIKREIIAIDNDIEAYLDGKISLWEKSHEGDLKNIQNVIKKEVTRAADGMFLLAALNMNALQSQETEGEIRDALGNFAKGDNKLDQAYQRTMERVQSQEASPKRLAIRSLAWIFHAKRPLSTIELLHALAVRPNALMPDESYLPNIKRLLSVCAGLVRLDEKSQVVDLIHKTTRDYFELTKETWFSGAESDIATTCITYLSFHTFKSGYCQTDSEFEERLRLHKLYNYAAHNWGHHARTASTSCQGVVEFLRKQGQVEASIQGLMAVKKWPKNRGYSQEISKQMTGLHLGAYFGVYDAVEVFSSNSPDPKDSYGCTPLSWAAENGHETVVQLLLDKGAEIDAKDSEGRTPLSWAARNGHKTVVQLLLDKGAEIDAKDGNGWTPLRWAARNGHETVVQLLLDKGAEINVEDKYGWKLLWWAARNGHKTVVQLLLNKGAEIDAKDGNGWTPLWWAAGSGDETVVQLLLDKGAEIDVKDSEGRTPLSWAAENGHETVVQLLLNKGAEIDAKDSNGWTPLWWAAGNGHETVVQLLLDKGAEIDAKDSNGRTPLSWAAKSGHKTVVQLLRKHVDQSYTLRYT